MSVSYRRDYQLLGAYASHLVHQIDPEMLRTSVESWLSIGMTQVLPSRVNG